MIFRVSHKNIAVQNFAAEIFGKKQAFVNRAIPFGRAE